MKKWAKVRMMSELEAYEVERNFFLSEDSGRHEAERSRLNELIAQKTASFSPRIDSGPIPRDGNVKMMFSSRRPEELWGYAR